MMQCSLAVCSDFHKTLKINRTRVQDESLYVSLSLSLARARSLRLSLSCITHGHTQHTPPHTHAASVHTQGIKKRGTVRVRENGEIVSPTPSRSWDDWSFGILGSSTSSSSCAALFRLPVFREPEFCKSICKPAGAAGALALLSSASVGAFCAAPRAAAAGGG